MFQPTVFYSSFTYHKIKGTIQGKEIASLQNSASHWLPSNSLAMIWWTASTFRSSFKSYSSWNENHNFKPLISTNNKTHFQQSALIQQRPFFLQCHEIRSQYHLCQFIFNINFAFQKTCTT